MDLGKKRKAFSKTGHEDNTESKENNVIALTEIVTPFLQKDR